MASRAIWPVALLICAGLFAGTPLARAGTKVYVIQPETDRRVAFAELSLSTLDGRPVRAQQARATTGRVGEPFDAGGVGKLNPNYGTLVLTARKHDIRGRLDITYDPDGYFWKQRYDPEKQAWVPDHDRSDWRPDVVYDWIQDPTDEEKGSWSSMSYAQWKADQVRREDLRVGEIKSAFMTRTDGELADGVDNGYLTEDMRGTIESALEDLLAADLKRSLPPERMKAVTDALDEASRALQKRIDAMQGPAAPSPGLERGRAARDLRSGIGEIASLRERIVADVNDVVRQIRTAAPKPPVVRVQLERRYVVPVVRGGYIVPVFGCYVPASPAASPQSCESCQGQ
jgi:hypothetical protein